MIDLAKNIDIIIPSRSPLENFLHKAAIYFHLIDSAVDSPLFRKWITDNIAGRINTRDPGKVAAGIDRFMREHFIYSYEPGEVVYSPLTFIHMKRGDCDDFAVFALAVAKELGFEGSFVIIKTQDGDWHQYALLLDNGNAYPIDGSQPVGMRGWEIGKPKTEFIIGRDAVADIAVDPAIVAELVNGDNAIYEIYGGNVRRNPFPLQSLNDLSRGDSLMAVPGNVMRFGANSFTPGTQFNLKGYAYEQPISSGYCVAPSRYLAGATMSFSPTPVGGETGVPSTDSGSSDSSGFSSVLAQLGTLFGDTGLSQTILGLISGGSDQDPSGLLNTIISTVTGAGFGDLGSQLGALAQAEGMGAGNIVAALSGILGGSGGIQFGDGDILNQILGLVAGGTDPNAIMAQISTMINGTSDDAGILRAIMETTGTSGLTDMVSSLFGSGTSPLDGIVGLLSGGIGGGLGGLLGGGDLMGTITGLLTSLIGGDPEVAFAFIQEIAGISIEQGGVFCGFLGLSEGSCAPKEGDAPTEPIMTRVNNAYSSGITEGRVNPGPFPNDFQALVELFVANPTPRYVNWGAVKSAEDLATVLNLIPGEWLAAFSDAIRSTAPTSDFNDTIVPSSVWRDWGIQPTPPDEGAIVKDYYALNNKLPATPEQIALIEEKNAAKQAAYEEAKARYENYTHTPSGELPPEFSDPKLLTGILAEPTPPEMEPTPDPAPPPADTTEPPPPPKPNYPPPPTPTPPPPESADPPEKPPIVPVSQAPAPAPFPPMEKPAGEKWEPGVPGYVEPDSVYLPAKDFLTRVEAENIIRDAIRGAIGEGAGFDLLPGLVGTPHRPRFLPEPFRPYMDQYVPTNSVLRYADYPELSDWESWDYAYGDVIPSIMGPYSPFPRNYPLGPIVSAGIRSGALNACPRAVQAEDQLSDIARALRIIGAWLQEQPMQMDYLKAAYRQYVNLQMAYYGLLDSIFRAVEHAFGEMMLPDVAVDLCPLYGLSEALIIAAGEGCEDVISAELVEDVWRRAHNLVIEIGKYFEKYQIMDSVQYI